MIRFISDYVSSVFRRALDAVILFLINYYTTPSIVAYDEDGKAPVGESALYAAVEPENIIYGIKNFKKSIIDFQDSKRMIGRQLIDKPVQDDMKLRPFKVVD